MNIRLIAIAGLAAAALTLSACSSGEDTSAPVQGPTVPATSDQVTQPPTIEVNKDAPVPNDVFGEDGAVPYGWQVNDFDSSRPTLTVFADFQCEGCGVFEGGPSAAYIDDLSRNGDINIIYRPTALRDFALGNSATAETTAAWGCAIDEGFGREYRNLALYNQTIDGSGVTMENLISGGELVGMNPNQQESFAACVESETYKDWAYNSTALIGSEFAGTPSATYNDELVPQEVLWTQELLQSFIEGGGQLVTPDAGDPQVTVPLVE
jgi:protein-disulfide isomerase